MVGVGVGRYTVRRRKLGGGLRFENIDTEKRKILKRFISLFMVLNCLTKIIDLGTLS